MAAPFNPFQNTNATPTTPVELTPLQRKAHANLLAQRLKTKAANTLLVLRSVQNEGIKTIWQDTRVSPQEIFDALGDDGYKLNEMHRLITEVLVTAAALYSTEAAPIDPGITLPTNAMTYAADGKVTVTDQPYVPA